MGGAALHFQDLVIVAIGVDGFVQLVQEFWAVARQEVNSAHAALLQTLVGIERLTQSFRVAGDEFALLRLRARSLGLKTFELVFNFRPCSFCGIDQRTVQLHQLVFDVGEV